MYAIVKTGGKQYRVERGQTLLVERLPVGEGESCSLEPLLYVDGDQLIDRGQDGAEVRVQARVVAHERGPKLRVVKFKPKRGYKRRTGHRQELTRIEITEIETGGGGRGQASRSASRSRKSESATRKRASGKAPASKARSGTKAPASRPGDKAPGSGASAEKEDSDGS